MKKKFIKTLSVFLLFIFIVNIPAFAVENTKDEYVLTLDEAVKFSLENSPDLEKADVMLGLAKWSKNDTSDTYDKLRDGIHNNIVGMNDRIEATEQQIAGYKMQYMIAPAALKVDIAAQIAALEVSKQGMYFSINTLSDLDEAKENLEEFSNIAANTYEDIQKGRDDAKEKVEFGTMKLYLSIFIMDKYIELQQQNITLQKEITEIERVKFRNGFGKAIDINGKNNKVSEEEKKLTDLKNTRLLLCYQMNRNIGREWTAPLKLFPVTFNSVTTLDMENGYKQAVEKNLEVQQYLRTIKNKQADLDDNIGSKEKPELEKANAELALEETKYNIRTRLEKLHHNVEISKKTLTEKKTDYETAKVDYEQTQVAYEQGLALMVHLDGKQILRDNAFVEYQKAQNDYYLAVRELQMAQQGIFLESVKTRS